jgi:triacylglycerol esterase/lipase EstA (alpha/beta hydrolase family)
VEAHGQAGVGAHHPVILVHGILGQRHLYWNVMKRRLGADGFRYHECIIPYGLLGDLRIAARYLRDKVLATLRGDEAERVDLVCHSAGGLVARYYMMYLGGAKRVGRVVTMGTPHQGTYFAYTMGLPWIVNVARQTRPGSHFLDEISGPGAVPQGVRFYNLWSRTDGLVLPSHNSKLAGSEAVHIPLATHWSFLWRKDVYDAIHAALEDRLVTTHGKAVVLPRPDATAPTGAPSHAPRD